MVGGAAAGAEAGDGVGPKGLPANALAGERFRGVRLRSMLSDAACRGLFTGSDTERSPDCSQVLRPRAASRGAGRGVPKLAAICAKGSMKGAAPPARAAARPPLGGASLPPPLLGGALCRLLAAISLVICATSVSSATVAANRGAWGAVRKPWERKICGRPSELPAPSAIMSSSRFPTLSSWRGSMSGCSSGVPRRASVSREAPPAAPPVSRLPLWLDPGVAMPAVHTF